MGDWSLRAGEGFRRQQLWSREKIITFIRLQGNWTFSEDTNGHCSPRVQLPFLPLWIPLSFCVFNFLLDSFPLQSYTFPYKTEKHRDMWTAKCVCPIKLFQDDSSLTRSVKKSLFCAHGRFKIKTQPLVSVHWIQQGHLDIKFSVKPHLFI